MFNPKPIFSSQGACFTTQQILKPEINGPLKIVLNVSNENFQGEFLGYSEPPYGRLELFFFHICRTKLGP